MRELGLSLLFSLPGAPVLTPTRLPPPQAALTPLTPPPPGVASCLLLQLSYAFTHWLYFGLLHPQLQTNTNLFCVCFVPLPVSWNVSSGEVGACLSYS